MNLGLPGELIFLVVVGLILFGPKKLPEIARELGRFVAELKRASSEFQGQLTREIGDADLTGTAKTLHSLVERVRAVSVAPSPAKAVMALTGTDPKKELGAVSLIENVNRIKELLNKEPPAPTTQDVVKPAAPKEMIAAEANGSSAATAQN